MNDHSRDGPNLVVGSRRRQGVDVEIEPEQADMAVDAGAFAVWAAPALVPMGRLARRLAPHADPDDVVQDALARAWQKRQQFDPSKGTAVTWLLAIVADLARASRRSRARWLKVV